MMATCSICGSRYDERQYQIVVRGLASFDAVECAQIALHRERRRRLAAPLELPSSARREQLALPAPASADGEPASTAN
jgi:hypothetical protein